MELEQHFRANLSRVNIGVYSLACTTFIMPTERHRFVAHKLNAQLNNFFPDSIIIEARSLCVTCVLWEYLFFHGVHGSSVQISPSHHLSHLEPSLLHVRPVLRVRLRHHLRLVDAQLGEHDGSRRERHRHAVVVVGVDRL